jgi:hypothetical protein
MQPAPPEPDDPITDDPVPDDPDPEDPEPDDPGDGEPDSTNPDDDELPPAQPGDDTSGKDRTGSEPGSQLDEGADNVPASTAGQARSGWGCQGSGQASGWFLLVAAPWWLRRRLPNILSSRALRG